MTSKKTWLGIDFSGNHLMWRKGCTRSNVWIAAVEESAETKELKRLCPVQRLDVQYGDRPFDRLVKFLSNENFEATGIDAPFSIPKRFIKAETHRFLLDEVDQMDLSDKRPFPEGKKFALKFLDGKEANKSPEFLRETEKIWARRAIPVRPTLWAEARGGAPFTAACLKLLAQWEGAIWPCEVNSKGKLLLEAFPLAQLVQWGEYREGYGKPGSKQNILRKEIVEFLEKKLKINDDQRNLMQEHPDALDAVICAFAAIAVTENRLANEPDPKFSKLEGWIAVHK